MRTVFDPADVTHLLTAPVVVSQVARWPSNSPDMLPIVTLCETFPTRTVVAVAVNQRGAKPDNLPHSLLNPKIRQRLRDVHEKLLFFFTQRRTTRADAQATHIARRPPGAEDKPLRCASTNVHPARHR